MNLNKDSMKALAEELAEVRKSNTTEGSPLFQAIMKQLEDEAGTEKEYLGSEHDSICEMADQISEAEEANAEGSEHE